MEVIFLLWGWLVATDHWTGLTIDMREGLVRPSPWAGDQEEAGSGPGPAAKSVTG
jgi:hypothetical protein